MSSRKRLTVYFFIIAFLINVGIGSTYLLNDEKLLSKTFNNNPTQPKISISHSKIIITGNLELDAFCAGNGTDGISWETAHVIENYEINGSVGDGISIINTRRFLIINNCKISNSSSTGIFLNNCTNVKIQNCISKSNSDQGIELINSERIVINNTDVLQNFNEGLRLVNTNNSEIIKSNISQNSKDGVYGHENCHNILFSENFIFDNSNGIFMYQDSSYISFIDNDILNNTGTGINGELNFGDIVIGNKISNNEGIGLELYECNSTIVENNIVMNNSAHGLSMWGGDSGNYNVISNNTFSNNSFDGIYFDDSNQHNIIENNEICFNGNNGIYMTDDQHNNTISINNISNNGNHGIWMERGSDNSTISDNVINDNYDAGIVIDGVETASNNNIIKYNKINGNPTGIILLESERNSIIGNLVSFCDDVGIVLEMCNHTKIFGNNVSYNAYGIQLDASHYNQIWMNIVSNSSIEEGFEGSAINLWDNGTVGNYWGNYTERYPGASANGNIWNTNYTFPRGTHGNDTKHLVNVDPMLDLFPSSNISYMVGETGHFVAWMITDTYYWNTEYFIYRNDELVKTGEWVSGDAVTVNVDGLEFGTYLFTNIAKDGTAWGKNELTIEVIVWAVPEPPVFITPSQTINSTNLTIQWAAANFTEYYNLYINNSYAGNTTSTNYTIEFDFNGDYLIELTAQNVYGVSNRSLSIVITVDNPNLEDSNNNLFWYFFGGGWILVLGFIGVSFVNVKLKKK